VDSGHLIYAAGGTLRAVGFDPVRLEVLSDPVPIVEQVWTKGNTAEYSVSRHSVLAYVPGGVVGSGLGAQRSLLWVNRQGREEPSRRRHAATSLPASRLMARRSR
jgi:hypothetical protein